MESDRQVGQQSSPGHQFDPGHTPVVDHSTGRPRLATERRPKGYEEANLTWRRRRAWTLGGAGVIQLAQVKGELPVDVLWKFELLRSDTQQ